MSQRRWLGWAVVVALATLGPATPPSSPPMSFVEVYPVSGTESVDLLRWRLQQQHSLYLAPAPQPYNRYQPPDESRAIAYVTAEPATATATGPSHFMPVAIVALIAAGLAVLGLRLRRRPSI